MTRQKRGTPSTKFNIKGFDQDMPQGNTWQNLLNVSEFKDQLIEMIKQFVLGFDSRILPRSVPFIIASREKIYFISVSNQGDADTCLLTCF